MHTYWPISIQPCCRINLEQDIWRAVFGVLMAIKYLRVLILCYKGQDLHLHTLHAIWGIWEDYDRQWADELLSEILPRFHPALRSVRNVQFLYSILLSDLWSSIVSPKQLFQASCLRSVELQESRCIVWRYEILIWEE